MSRYFGYVLLTVLALAACSGDGTTSPEPVGSLSLKAPSTMLDYGQTVQVEVTLRSGTGKELPGRPVSWSSSNSDIAAVTATGLVTAGAVREGATEVATILATAEGKTATLPITVKPIAVASVDLVLPRATLLIGQTLLLGVTLRDATGGSLSGRTVSWSTGNPGVASISSSGVVTAISVGQATLTASVEGRSATATVTVSPVPVAAVQVSPSTATLDIDQTQPLTATARDSAGNSLTGRAVTWSTSSPALAAVSATGVVTAVAPGQVTVTAKVDGIQGAATITVRALPAIMTTVAGNGLVVLRNIRTTRTDTIRSSQSVSVMPRDSIEITPVAGPSALFDGITGVVTDTVQLLPTYGFRATGNGTLGVRFVSRNTGIKSLQNAYFDTTALNYRTSRNFVVWWDKRWDHNYIAKDILRSLEAVREKADSWGMRRPPGSDRVYINVYLHHRTGEGMGNIDIFDDAWGQGVGTDSFGMPFYTAPLGPTRIRLDPTYCCTIGAVWHEGFHLHQWTDTNFPPVTFRYGGENSWYSEGSADWIEKYFNLNETSQQRDSLVWFNGTPAFLMQPQQALWSSGRGGPPTWSRGVHAYATHLFLLYLTWNKIIPEDFIGRSYASATTLSPQEYLYRAIPNFREVYRRFAARIVVLDGMPDWAKGYLRFAINWWRTFGAQYGNALPGGGNDDNTYAFDLKDSGTSGWVTPSAALESWAFSVTRLQATSAARYRISLSASRAGSEQTPADLYVGLVFEENGNVRYDEIPLTDYQGTVETAIAANVRMYVVVVSTPNRFTGAETFPYSIKIDKLP